MRIEAFNHRRSIELEYKAKFVPSVWGKESLPRLLFCLSLFGTNGWVQPFIPNKPAEFNRLFQIDRLSSTVCRAKQLARQVFCFCPPKQTGWHLPCLLMQSFFYAFNPLREEGSEVDKISESYCVLYGVSKESNCQSAKNLTEKCVQWKRKRRKKNEYVPSFFDLIETKMDPNSETDEHNRWHPYFH